MKEARVYLGCFVFGVIIASLVWSSFWPKAEPKPTQIAQIETTPPVAKPYENGSGSAIYIRGSRWSLMVGTEDEMLDLVGMYGITNCVTKKVYVRGSLDLENQRDTIVHELLHAGTCDESGKVHNKFYNSENDTDHEGIYKIADYFTTLLHDNPELGKFLYQ